jgi:energy-coupling factor transporter ATP-binding protein EcfA2
MIEKIKIIIRPFLRKDNLLHLDLGDYLLSVKPCRNLRFHGIGSHMRTEFAYSGIVKARGRFLFEPELEQNPHVVICGMSGFGKSTMFGAILRGAASHGVSCIIFDAHDEHAETVKEMGGNVYSSISERINLLSLDGATISERISILGSLFRRVFNLGYIQATKLNECLWYTYRRFGARSYLDRKLESEPVIRDLIYEINVFIRNARTASERNGLLHLRDRLSVLKNNIATKGLDLTGLSTGVHSFSLSGMKSREERTIYLEELLGRLYGQMKDGRKETRLKRYIMIDEAQFVINSSDSDMVTRFIEEGRKYGVGMVIATHSSTKLNRQVVANAATFVSFYSREPSETAFVSKVMAGQGESDAVQSMVSGLNVHEAVVFSSRKRSASKISMKRILRFNRSNSDDSIRVARLSIWPVQKDRLESAYGIDPKLIESMIKSGALQSFSWLGKDWVSSRKSNPGIEHEVVVSKIQQQLSEKHIASYIYDKAGGPDIVVSTSHGHVAIEYETGTKNINESAAMIRGRLGKYISVVVIAKDPSKYEFLSTDKISVIPLAALDTISNLFQ